MCCFSFFMERGKNISLFRMLFSLSLSLSLLSLRPSCFNGSCCFLRKLLSIVSDYRLQHRVQLVIRYTRTDRQTGKIRKSERTRTRERERSPLCASCNRFKCTLSCPPSCPLRSLPAPFHNCFWGFRRSLWYTLIYVRLPTTSGRDQKRNEKG